MGQSRVAESPKIPRAKWVSYLHRRPARWDVLLHKLGEDIARRYWYTQVHFRQEIWKLEAEELSDLGMFAAREFGRRQSYAAIADLAGGQKQPTILDLPKCPPGQRLSLLDRLVADATSAIIDCIANYLEIAHNCFVKRNHPDLELLRPRLEQACMRFLRDKCMDDGELVPALLEPAADDSGYFPEGDLPADPAEPSGSAALDAYRLNVLVHDADDAVTMMAKLTMFAKSDPMLAPEFTVEMVTNLAARRLHYSKQQRPYNETAEAVDIRDHFIFSPCRQGGQQPIDIFIQRQPLASERQLERLKLWAAQHTDGIWRIEARTDEDMELRDLGSGRALQVQAEPTLAPMPDGSVLRARVLPWDGGWILWGTAQLVTGESATETRARQMLHPLLVRRAADNDDPRLLAGRRLVKVVHDAFEQTFGAEWAEFETLAQCREKLAGLHHHLLTETRLPDGRQFADAWQQDVDCEFPPFMEDRFAADEQAPAAPGVVYDAVHGMAFLPDAKSVRLAVQSPFPTLEQQQAFARLLLEKWRPGWLVQRLADERPDRAQEIIRSLLGDESFDVHRDLRPLLGRLKCPDHTLPDRPTPFLVS